MHGVFSNNNEIRYISKFISFIKNETFLFKKNIQMTLKNDFLKFGIALT